MSAPIAAPRRLGEQVWVTGQISPGQIAGLREQGFTWLVNHRPDHEESGQPSSTDIESAAAEAGLTVLHAPAHGLPDAAVVQATRDLLDALEPDDKVLMFCRSGMRSAAAWAMAERRAGGDSEMLRATALSAGYDLGRVPL